MINSPRVLQTSFTLCDWMKLSNEMKNKVSIWTWHQFKSSRRSKLFFVFTFHIPPPTIVISNRHIWQFFNLIPSPVIDVKSFISRSESSSPEPCYYIGLNEGTNDLSTHYTSESPIELFNFIWLFVSFSASTCDVWDLPNIRKTRYKSNKK